ncbi:GH16523 [Drosophila grimshawi]|uniref:GH16523 n=1 Tax=Drosophila grimshawi TaxID=7222 RepID=B4J132_DROGR|nr:GH16523 [Drosophila grimshawi]
MCDRAYKTLVSTRSKRQLRSAPNAQQKFKPNCRTAETYDNYNYNYNYNYNENGDGAQEKNKNKKKARASYLPNKMSVEPECELSDEM